MADYKDPENTLLIETTKGNVVIEMRPDLAPGHVAHIKKLAREGAYDGVVFHRVIDGFMAQTGDVKFGKSNSADFAPARTGTGGSSYPDLKASENFRDLHNKLVDTENQIQYARRYYNGAVNLLNNRIQRFPDLLIANTFGFKPAEFFDLEDPAAANAPGVALQ